MGLWNIILNDLGKTVKQIEKGINDIRLSPKKAAEERIKGSINLVIVESAIN